MMDSAHSVSLREYIEAILHEKDRALQALAATHGHEVQALKENVLELARIHDDAHAREHALTQTALEKAEQSLTIRLESMNELRSQIYSERGTYVTRDMLETKMAALDTQLDSLGVMVNRRLGELENKQANLDGRFLILGGVLGVAIVLVQVAAHLLVR